ncbi:MAG: COX15/CtaA family protein [Burkholderiales bacterium]|nr:COX15/CtaA family protein [Burkholderiales bacterium]
MKMNAIEHSLIGAFTIGIICVAFLWVGRDSDRYRKLVTVAMALTFMLVILGAFVRLSDAGLGCPDWPGCYGNLTPHHSAADIRAAEMAQPGGPVSMDKAWKEMLHRYLAMFVGALIAAIMFAAWRSRRAWKQSPTLATVIACAVIFQAALGAWTVTMLLRPAIVTSHLLGGIAILSLLTWLHWRQVAGGSHRPNWAKGIIASNRVRVFAFVSLAVLFGQIVLGGWVSTNYAALACSDLPLCNGQLLPKMDFVNAFHVIRPLGFGPDGELLTLEALRAIHWIHRLGAMVTVLVVGGFALSLLKIHSGSTAAKMLLALLIAQVFLGISNVWFSLPLAVAVAHNGVAAILFSMLLLINLRLYDHRN